MVTVASIYLRYYISRSESESVHFYRLRLHRKFLPTPTPHPCLVLAGLEGEGASDPIWTFRRLGGWAKIKRLRRLKASGVLRPLDWYRVTDVSKAFLTLKMKDLKRSVRQC
jgi:hypothetical protein